MPSPTERSAADYLADIDQARRRGDLLLAFDTAWSGAKAFDDNLLLKYQAVLALARTGATAGAEALYQRWQLKQQPNEDFQALAGRLAKDQALRSSGPQRSELALRSARLYETVWRQTNGYYPAINAATMYLIGGQPVTARQLAATVLTLLASTHAKDATGAYFELASAAEANLILGRLDALRASLEAAAHLRGDDWQLGSTTRRQLLLLCDVLELPGTLIDALKPPTCAHFCGHIIGSDDQHPRFPAGQQQRVRAQIEQVIEQYDIRFGFGSAAAGADLMFAEALLERGGEVHLVLPFCEQEFIQTSLSASGPQWLPRFQRCIDAAKRAGTLFQATNGGYQQDNELFAYASHIAMGSAYLHSTQLGSSLLQVAVWDGIDTGAGAGTGGDIRRWRAHGSDTVVINSLDPQSTPRHLAARADDQQQPAPNLAATPQATSGDSKDSDQPLPTRRLRAFLFGDIKGFTQLREEQLPMFQHRVMGAFGEVLDQFEDIVYRNTWGDALYIVFTQVSDAAACAARLQEALAALPLADLGLPEQLSLRIGMHYGPVYEGRDEVLRKALCYGTEVSRAARIEPITPPGEIYATEAFAAALAFDAGERFCADYVGRVQTAKNYGEFRMYHIRRGRGER